MKTEKPVLIFDGDCFFCRHWIERWRYHTGDLVSYSSYQESKEAYADIPEENLRQAVHYIEPGGGVYRGAHAVFKALSQAPGKRWYLRLYEKLPGFKAVSELLYGVVARHRVLFSKLTRLFLGPIIGPPNYQVSSWLFLRCLGLIYLIAFVSLWVQIEGLIGAQGILPAKDFMAYSERRFGPMQLLRIPTLLWFNSGDAFLHFLCLAGTVASLFLLFGFLPLINGAIAWVIYLSMIYGGQDFYSFQWDILLVEAGFLSLFLCPIGFFPRLSQVMPVSKTVVWLFKWLLFRLIFASAMVKLLSGDPAWQNLTALNYHYETQPIASWISWYVHQFPAWFDKAGVLFMFFAELVIPFLFFFGRPVRLFALKVSVALQLLIILTGNYCFFNLLTMALCLFLVDDLSWPVWVREKAGLWGNFLKGKSMKLHGEIRPLRLVLRRLCVFPVFAVLLMLSLMNVERFVRFSLPWPEQAIVMRQVLAPLRLVNRYGLFAVMTKTRPEIIVEGSNDGSTWKAYEFRYKAGDLHAKPRFVAPYQPRLDWQMWFAALGNFRQNPWFVRFCLKLLQGSPEVIKLLKTNPFPEGPPAYIRARVFDYRFTTWAERRQTGQWWKRDAERAYLPAISLKEGFGLR